MVAPSTYAEDSGHPIPAVDTLDVYGIRKGGGATLTVVIASPISSDRRSLDRLMKKIENYLGFIQSDTFVKECGPPSEENTTLEVYIHPDSDPEVFDLLDRCHGWVSDNNARLHIRKEANQSVQTRPTNRPV